MSKLSRDDVLKLAELARLSLSEAEISQYQIELSQVLEYVKQLQDVNTDGLEQTNHVTGLVNVMRSDKITSYGYDPKDLLANVPKTKDDQIQVKRMVE